MSEQNSKRFLKIVADECARIVGNHMIPRVIADELSIPKDKGGILFSEHPVALAALPLAAYEATGGDDARDIAPAGAAIEFLLAAGDVLDDLQDNPMPPAASGIVHAEYVRKTELVTALVLLSEHAILAIRSEKVPTARILRVARIFSKLKCGAFTGQYDDAHATDSASTTPHQTLQRTQKKSGNLGKYAGILGASLATDDEDSIELAAKLGTHLAMVYQLKNDIRDIWPDSGFLDDATTGKATSPTAFALAIGEGEAGSSAVARLLENKVHSDSDVENARNETFKSGGMHFAMIQAFAHLARTNSIADQLASKHQSPNVLTTLIS